jgi:hypothetical protein
MNGSTEGRRGSNFLKKYHMKNFSKAVGWDANPDSDPRIRIHQKNSPKCKMQIIPDPDVVRIRESYQKQCECIRIQIPESGFKNFYADPRFALGPYRTVRTRSSGSNWATNSSYVRVPIIRLLVEAWEYYLPIHFLTIFMVIP